MRASTCVHTGRVTTGPSRQVELLCDTLSNIRSISAASLLLLEAGVLVLTLVLDVELKFFDFFKVTVDFLLKAIILRFEIVSLMDHIRQVLVPLGAFTLMVQQKLGLLGLGLGALSFQLALLLVEDLALLLHLLLNLRQLGVSFALDCVQLSLESLDRVLKLLNFLTEVALFRDLVAARQL